MRNVVVESGFARMHVQYLHSYKTDFFSLLSPVAQCKVHLIRYNCLKLKLKKTLMDKCNPNLRTHSDI